MTGSAHLRRDEDRAGPGVDDEPSVERSVQRYRHAADHGVRRAPARAEPPEHGQIDERGVGNRVEHDEVLGPSHVHPPGMGVAGATDDVGDQPDVRLLRRGDQGVRSAAPRAVRDDRRRELRACLGCRELRGPFYRPDPGMYEFLSERLYRFGLERTSRAVVESFLGRPVSPDALIRDLGRLRGGR